MGLPAVSTRDLTKSYRTGRLRMRRCPALDHLTLEVQQGEIFGFLGPNGAGKTTTLKLLLGLLHPDAGSAVILGQPSGSLAWRYRVGYLPENPYLYDYLTAREYLDYVGRLFGMPSRLRRSRAQDLLDEVGLVPFAEWPLRRFSKGMLQRVGLAQALMNEPDLVFLDEPMSGLDPIGRRLVRDIILGLKRAGRTVFFSTHILPDAEALCDRVGLLRGGRLVKAGRLDEILSLDASHLEVLVSGTSGDCLHGLVGVQAQRAVGERWHLQVADGCLGPVVAAVEAAGGRVVAVNCVRQSLEDYFFREISAAQRDEQWTPAR